MKHAEAITEGDVVRVLSDVGIEVGSRQAGLIAHHSRLVLATNLSMNLTRVTEKDAVLRLHIADSATALAEVNQSPDGPMVDIGSGAGYPGIPLAILSQRQTTLVESVKKKAMFLEACVADMGLPIDVLANRAEEVAGLSEARYACCTARALSSLPALVELSAPLLVAKGRLIALKGPISREELDRGDQAALMCGMKRSAHREFELSQGERRTILVYTSVGKPRVALPRRTGLAQRQPLA